MLPVHAPQSRCELQLATTGDELEEEPLPEHWASVERQPLPEPKHMVEQKPPALRAADTVH